MFDLHIKKLDLPTTATATLQRFTLEPGIEWILTKHPDPWARGANGVVYHFGANRERSWGSDNYDAPSRMIVDDPFISAPHAWLIVDDAGVRVLRRKEPSPTTNAFIVQGKQQADLFDFRIAPGESFTIYNVAFSIRRTHEPNSPFAPVPGGEMQTLSPDMINNAPIMGTLAGDEGMNVFGKVATPMMDSIGSSEWMRRINSLIDLTRRLSLQGNVLNARKEVTRTLFEALPDAHYVAIAEFLPDEANQVRVHQEETRPNSHYTTAHGVRKGILAETYRYPAPQCALVIKEGGEAFAVGTGVMPKLSPIQMTVGESPEGMRNWVVSYPLYGPREPKFCLYVSGLTRQVIDKQSKNPAQNPYLGPILKFLQLVAVNLAAHQKLLNIMAVNRELVKFAPSLVSNLLSSQGSAALQSRDIDATVIFSDLRGFTGIVEAGNEDLGGVWRQVEECLNVMSDNIDAQYGVISDFQGDAAMGFWGWPESKPTEQALRAAKAAIEIEDGFRRINQRNVHHDFSCGIGLAHSREYGGRLGTSDQSKIGVFGNVVNLAARLQSLTRTIGVSILVDEAFYLKCDSTAEIQRSDLRFREIGLLLPKGMKIPCRVYQLLSKEEARDDNTSFVHTEYANARMHFTGDATGQPEWGVALSLLSSLISIDGPSQFLYDFIERNCVRGQAPKDWDGVIVMAGK